MFIVTRVVLCCVIGCVYSVVLCCVCSVLQKHTLIIVLLLAGASSLRRTLPVHCAELCPILANSTAVSNDECTIFAPISTMHLTSTV